MTYELIPGVKQDEKGRDFQLGRYPNGKLIVVPYHQPRHAIRAMLAHVWHFPAEGGRRAERCLTGCEVCK